jgi:hypothetical protein
MYLDRQTRAAIGRDYQKMPVVNVLRKYGISRKLLYQVIRKKRGAMNRKVDDGVASTIATLNMRGHSDRDIARKLGLTQDTVSRHRSNLGLTPVPRDKVRRNG